MRIDISTFLVLFGAEMKKVWNRPILELTIVLLGLISVSSIQTLTQISVSTEATVAFQSLVVNGVSGIITQQMLPLIILCSILMSLSFARDYEQGLMQTLLSSPVSRASFFIAKFIAVILPLACLAWGFVVFFIALNYYSNIFLVLQFTAMAFPFILLSLFFFGSIAALVSLAIKRTIPSALTCMLIGLFFWFITTLTYDTIGTIANYLVLTPYKAPLITLDRLIGINYSAETVAGSLPAWNFAFLTLLYACIILFPTYLYFTRRFEIRE